MSNVRFIRQDLRDISDSEELSLGENCEKKQIAVNRVGLPVHPTRKMYTIDERLWEKLDEEQKAGLILHEIIYSFALKNGAKNSINARYYNSVISSSDFSSLDPFTYGLIRDCLLYTSPSPRDATLSRMPSSA